VTQYIEFEGNKVHYLIIIELLTSSIILTHCNDVQQMAVAKQTETTESNVKVFRLGKKKSAEHEYSAIKHAFSYNRI